MLQKKASLWSFGCLRRRALKAALASVYRFLLGLMQLLGRPAWTHSFFLDLEWACLRCAVHPGIVNGQKHLVGMWLLAAEMRKSMIWVRKESIEEGDDTRAGRLGKGSFESRVSTSVV